MTPVLLLILDGWGVGKVGSSDNATSVAQTPNLDSLLATCPHSELIASGLDVGLPEGYMGNSEVGHLNIGAGRIVYQDMTKIDLALQNGTFEKNTALTTLMEATKANGGRLHLAGLLSDGGVHSHIKHLVAICKLAHDKNIPVRIHCIMDGRDTPPTSGVHYLEQLQKDIAGFPEVKIASMIGRFYAMDRDKRWERVCEAWNLLVHGKGEQQPDCLAAIKASYATDITDEFVKPVVFSCEETFGMKDGDGLFLFNFRADRMREITHAFVDENFDGFDRGYRPRLSGIASMTPYEAAFTIPAAFPKESVALGLGEMASLAGLKQLRLAETEKYAHVTYFFNGGMEAPFPNEDRILVPSPRDVATYDLKPAMSAREVTDKFLDAWQQGIYDLVVCNLANGDMVGHTGILSAAVEACEVVDECIGRMVQAVRERNGRMLIIADHGNCECMRADDGQPHTAHTTNPVPCILVDSKNEIAELSNGRLADVAPTILSLWGMDSSASMTGTNLAKSRQ